jgi:hypothetical protein
MISSNREDVSTSEMAYLDSIIEKSLNLNTIHFGKSPRKVK